MKSLVRFVARIRRTEGLVPFYLRGFRYSGPAHGSLFVYSSLCLENDVLIYDPLRERPRTIQVSAEVLPCGLTVSSIVMPSRIQ